MISVLSTLAEMQKISDDLRKKSDIDIKKHIEYKNSMKRLGFKPTALIETVSKVERMIEERKSLAFAFEYYRKNYPNFHVIPTCVLFDVSERFKLISGRIDRYSVNVPEKNLKEIERFVNDIKIPLFDEDILKYDSKNYSKSISDLGELLIHKSLKSAERHLFITAPREHFVLEHRDKIIGSLIVPNFRKNLKNSMQEAIDRRRKAVSEMNMRSILKDPIVWAPVWFPLKGGAVMVASKWGPEADIPEFTNPLDN